MEEELNRTMEKLETAQKMTAVYEHQMKHNKKMADKGLVDAIIGLPTPTPDQLTVDDIEDIPHEVQEKIFKEWRQAEIEDLQADMADDARYEDEMMTEMTNGINRRTDAKQRSTFFPLSEYKEGRSA